MASPRPDRASRSLTQRFRRFSKACRVEEKCEDETSGYTTNTKCSKWPKEVCSVSKKPVKKYTPITGCTKEPIELCAPAGCGFKQGPEECYDKVQTVVQDAPKE